MKAWQYGARPRLCTWGLRVGMLALLLAETGIAQAAPSLCEGLAQTLSRTPAAASQQAADPLKQRLALATAQPLALAAAELSESVAVELLPEVSPAELALERLPGQALLHLYTYQGTAGCQLSRFALPEGAGRWRLVAGPALLDERSSPCGTLSGSLARLDGQPVFVVHGRERQTEEAEVYRLAAWEGAQWGPSCSLHLRYPLRYRLESAHCAAAPAICRRAQALALSLGERYDRARASGARFEPPRAARAPAALKAALSRLDLTVPPAFPGAERAAADAFTAGYANADLQAFALSMDGRWFLALLGHAGVGWRESAQTLLGLYVPDPAGQLLPVAGYRVLRERAGPPLLQAEGLR